MTPSPLPPGASFHYPLRPMLELYPIFNGSYIVSNEIYHILIGISSLNKQVRCDAASLGVPCTNCVAFSIECKIPTPKRKKNQSKAKDVPMYVMRSVAACSRYLKMLDF